MKKLLVVSLLSIIVLLFISCNTYDVEGKPEVAANPAKKVFAYYPWGTGEDTTVPEEEEEECDEDVVEEQDEDGHDSALGDEHQEEVRGGLGQVDAPPVDRRQEQAGEAFVLPFGEKRSAERDGGGERHRDPEGARRRLRPQRTRRIERETQDQQRQHAE